MTTNNPLDLYSDYLISAFGQTTTIGLSAMLKVKSVMTECSDLWQENDRVQWICGE
jgi:hypothetical protein